MQHGHVQKHDQQAGASPEAVLVGEDGPPGQDPPAPLPNPCQGWPRPYHSGRSTAYALCWMFESFCIINCDTSPSSMCAGVISFTVLLRWNCIASLWVKCQLAVRAVHFTQDISPLSICCISLRHSQNENAAVPDAASDLQFAGFAVCCALH